MSAIRKRNERVGLGEFDVLIDDTSLISTYFSHSEKCFGSLNSSWQRCVGGLHFATRVNQPLTARFTRSNDFHRND